MWTKRQGIMLCQPFEEKRLLKWQQELVITQPKLDGERCRAIKHGTHVQLLSSEMNEILSVPHINEQLALANLPDGEFDGELYFHGMNFNDIHSIVSRKTNLHPDFMKMEFHLFDLINNEDQTTRSMQLLEIWKDLYASHIKLVPFNITKADTESILFQMNIFNTHGYEGIIVRHPFNVYERKRSLFVMKFKPKQSDIYRIINLQEEIDKHGQPKGTLGAFICVGRDDTPFGVGSGFTAQQRREYWQLGEALIGRYLRVNYQAKSNKGVPRFPIFCELLKDEFTPMFGD